MAEFFCPNPNEITPDFSETARYIGYSKVVKPDEQVLQMIHKAASEMQPLLKPQAVFDTFDLSFPAQNIISFCGKNIESYNLSVNLNGCQKVILFAATLGPQVDAFIRKSQFSDQAYASVLQATGAMFIEQLVDMLNKKIADHYSSIGAKTKPRFSPGYGDVSLAVQKIFFDLLPCTKIGLSLMDSLIMAPEKSVTAFIGITSK